MFYYSHLADVGIEELTLAWNRCWQGYAYEVRYSTAQMQGWLEKCRIDLSHSTALRDSQRLLGFALLALEDQMGWIAGTCIDPEFRGRRLFRPLLENQLARAESLQLKGIKLEVLSHNHAARSYEGVGFQKKRDLYVYRYHEGIPLAWANPGRGCSLRQANLSDYFQARHEAGFHPPWQRQEGYLRRYTALRAWLNSEGTAGILMPQENHVVLDAWTMAWEQAEKLISFVLSLSQGEFVLTNQPKDWLTAYLSRQGVNPSDIQYEMIYPMHPIQSAGIE
ncbi:GNAT family acetyltransferase [Desulfitobacterium hafniense]|uniref:GNAT family acetyltransferase n=1 Tax=Desulfitobacterium hafniense TaxID=49338 RepID=A0A0W1JHB6_DESHA|nr:GNAT family N-acetyltransferase [Desulfitobacterium hafniense]KTE91100.1 GNAT family acetyltransferase [Desulfitobacterium hafniense]